MSNIQGNSVKGRFLGFKKNIFSKNQNLEICIGTFSMRRIWLYGHIWPKIEVFAGFGGLGILPYFIPYIYPIGPVWGLLLGSYI